jgi:hypothetical protein
MIDSGAEPELLQHSFCAEPTEVHIPLAAVDVVNYIGHRASSGSWRLAIGKIIRNTVPRGDPGVVVNRP